MIPKSLKRVTYPAIFASLLIGGPYLYKSVTTPWAGTGDGKLTGTWVGAISIQRTSEPTSAADSGVTPPADTPGAVMMNIRLSPFSGMSALATGRVTECERGGPGFTTNFPANFVNRDATGPGFSLTAAAEGVPSGNMPSFFDTHWDGQNIIKIDFVALIHPSVQGTLHKGSEVEFMQMCNQLKN